MQKRQYKSGREEGGHVGANLRKLVSEIEFWRRMLPFQSCDKFKMEAVHWGNLPQRLPSQTEGCFSDSPSITCLPRRDKTRQCFGGRRSGMRIAANTLCASNMGIIAPSRRVGHVCMASEQGSVVQTTQTAQKGQEAIQAILFDMV